MTFLLRLWPRFPLLVYDEVRRYLRAYETMTATLTIGAKHMRQQQIVNPRTK